MTFKEYIRDTAQDIQEKERQMRLYGYYHQIMDEEKCSMEEAVRMTVEDPTCRIGVKMIDYGLWGLKTKKGRRKFRDTMLTNEEQIIWDSPERPDRIGSLIIEAGKITMSKGGQMIKEVYKHEKK
jgi:hypothetical protein